jgi:steroid 5-alpha reductase family enzyme
MLLILKVACGIWLLQTLAFGLSIWTKKNSIADVFWGFSMAVVALLANASFILFAFEANPTLALLTPSVAISFMMAIWGFRLTYHIGSRFIHKNKEDKRYAKMSEGWKNYYLRSYLQVFMLQGALMFGMMAALLVAILNAPETNLYLLAAGVTVWAFGLIFEIISDAQLAKFVKTKKPGQIMKKGLWKFSRHPNYFGEVVSWWGIWIVVANAELWWAALITPLVITFLILKVSGVPMAEAHYADNEEFQSYAKYTNKFFPWWPKN